MIQRLTLDNLYANGQVLVLPSGTSVLKRERYVLEPSENDKLHIVQEGETLSMIAGNYYEGKSSFYFLIADANNIKKIWGIQPGQYLRIPDLIKFKSYRK